MERKYSVGEIDALRQACEMKWLFGTTRQQQNGGMSRTYRQEEKDAGVEQLVRTYMLAGITAPELYESDNPG